MALAAEHQQRALEDGVELLDAQHLFRVREERFGKLLGERERRRDLEHARVRVAERVQRFLHVHRVDAAGHDHALRVRAVCAVRFHRVAAVCGKVACDLRVALFDARVRLQRELRENDPARVLFKMPRRDRPADVVGIDDGAGVADARRRAEQHRRAVLFGVVERLADHVVRLLRRRGVEHRQLRILREGARILLGLRGDRAGIVGDEHDHAALHADVREAHQRVGGDVQADLLHRHQRALAGVRRAGGHLERDLFVYGPLDVDVARARLRDRLEHLGRGRAGIAGHNADARADRAEADGGVAHQQFFHCNHHSLFFVPVGEADCRFARRGKGANRV